MYKAKVLVLTSSYPKYKGDINGNFVHELALRLKSNFDIFVLAPAYKGSLSYEIIDDIKIYRHKQFLIKNVELAYGIGIYENLKRNKLKYFILPFYFFFQLLFIKRLTQKEKINIVHAHWLIPNAFIAVICKKIFKIDFKIISTIHGSDFWGFNNKLGGLLKKYTLNSIDSLTVVSNAIRDSLVKFGYKKEAFVYPMGLDTNLFSPSKRDEALKNKLQIKGPFLLFVGTIVEQKGIRHLIQALPATLKKFPDAKLVVIGDGNLKNEMVELAYKLNISSNIIFLGSIQHNDLPAYFATADLFVMPSFSEGFGLVIIEAMSCKTIAVTTNLEVIHDIISENETGFFFEEISKDSISKKIISVLNNYENFDNIKEKGRQSVIEKFDWNIVNNNYSSLLNKLLE